MSPSTPKMPAPMAAKLTPQLNWFESNASERSLPASPPKLTPKNGMRSTSACARPGIRTAVSKTRAAARVRPRGMSFLLLMQVRPLFRPMDGSSARWSPHAPDPVYILSSPALLVCCHEMSRIETHPVAQGLETIRLQSPSLNQPGDFNLAALHAALDAQRQARRLSWAQALRE